MDTECRRGQAVRRDLFVGAVQGCLGPAMAWSICGDVWGSRHLVVEYLGLGCEGPLVMDWI